MLDHIVLHQPCEVRGRLSDCQSELHKNILPFLLESLLLVEKSRGLVRLNGVPKVKE